MKMSGASIRTHEPGYEAPGYDNAYGLRAWGGPTLCYGTVHGSSTQGYVFINFYDKEHFYSGWMVYLPADTTAEEVKRLTQVYIDLINTQRVSKETQNDNTN